MDLMVVDAATKDLIKDHAAAVIKVDAAVVKLLVNGPQERELINLQLLANNNAHSKDKTSLQCRINLKGQISLRDKISLKGSIPLNILKLKSNLNKAL